jgi:hypothetical protein
VGSRIAAVLTATIGWLAHSLWSFSARCLDIGKVMARMTHADILNAIPGVKKVDHIAIAVRSIEASRKQFESIYGARHLGQKAETDGPGGARAAPPS